MRAAPATPCSRSAQRRTSTRFASTTGSGATSTDGSGLFTSTTPSRTSTAVDAAPASRELVPAPTVVRDRARLEGAAARSPSGAVLRRAPSRLRGRGRRRHEGPLPRPQPRRGRRHRDRDRVGATSTSLSFAETIVVPAAVGGVPAAPHPRGQLQGREGVRAVSDRGRIASIDLGGSHVSAGRIDVASGRCRPSVRVALPPDAGRDELLTRSPARPRTSSRALSTASGSPSPGPFDYAQRRLPARPTSSSPCTAWICGARSRDALRRPRRRSRS